MTFDYKEHLMNEQIDYAWEVFEESLKDGILKDYIDKQDYSWSMSDPFDDARSILEWAIENNFEETVNDPIGSYKSNEDEYWDEIRFQQELIREGGI